MPRPPNEAGPGRPVVCVQGLGFAGAAMAVAAACARDERGEPRYSVVGIDLPTPTGRHRIDRLDKGEFPHPTTDRALALATARVHAEGTLRASADPEAFGEADVVLVDVNLDLDPGPGPAAVDFSGFRDAIRSIGRRMRPGGLVIVEATAPPGTCERVVAPELAAAFRARGLPEDAFLLAHSYERVMPGEDYLASITHFWRVYAGHTPPAAAACERFLASVVDVAGFPLTRLASTTASELAKLMENSYRATNIAFVDEWTRFAEAVGVDLFSVIDAIRVRPTHANIRSPGLGVGGYCLTKDPLFAGVAVRQLFERPELRFPFSERAVDTNRAMPIHAVDRLEALLRGSLAGARVLLLGVAYRPGVADTRHSASQLFFEEAQRRGARVTPHDPLVGHWPELAIDVAREIPEVDAFDAAVFAVAHDVYRELDLARWLRRGAPAVLDANGVLDDAQRRAVAAAGCAFGSVGRG